MKTTRRSAIGQVLALAGAAVAPRLASREGVAAQAAPAGAGTRVMLLGTQGGPNYTATRGEAANAVIAGGQPYLIDCGYGALAALKKAGVNHRQIGRVFLTHLLARLDGETHGKRVGKLEAHDGMRHPGRAPVVDE